MSFNKATYHVTVTVLDEKGRALGSAQGDVAVDKILERTFLVVAREWMLDFGKSADFPRAKTFEITINGQRTLAPDNNMKPTK